VLNEGGTSRDRHADETPVVPPSPDPFYMPLVSSEFSRSAMLKIINQLCILVSRLHEKGIIHGDVKPLNLLLCSEGELRFTLEM
jgi:serine/threonine protein kinase